jgi:rubrerythrin
MSYPFDEQNSDIENGREIDLEMLREDLIGELQAINQYQEHIEILEDEDAISVLEHIRDDEKEHVAELVKMIQRLDAVQAEKFKKELL